MFVVVKRDVALYAYEVYAEPHDTIEILDTDDGVIEKYSVEECHKIASQLPVQGIRRLHENLVEYGVRLTKLKEVLNKRLVYSRGNIIYNGEKVVQIKGITEQSLVRLYSPIDKKVLCEICMQKSVTIKITNIFIHYMEKIGSYYRICFVVAFTAQLNLLPHTSPPDNSEYHLRIFCIFDDEKYHGVDFIKDESNFITDIRMCDTLSQDLRARLNIYNRVN